MKKSIFFLILIVSWNCISSKSSKALKAYYQMSKANSNPLFNFVVDTRGIDSNGQLQVRSIRYFDVGGESYLLYPKIDSVSLQNFEVKRNFTMLQIDSMVGILLKQQEKTNAESINSTPKSGELVYFTFANDNKILVYCPNTNKIGISYWKNYVANGEKLDSSWYIIVKN